MQDDLVGTSDTLSDDSGIAGLEVLKGGIKRVGAGVVEDNEARLWAETIAQAVDEARNVLDMRLALHVSIAHIG